MAKTKKLLIFTPFFPPHTGGLETHVYEFAKHLSESGRGYKVTVFAPNIPETKEVEKINESFTVIRYPAFMISKASQNPLPKFWRWKFWKQLQIAGRNDPDFVMSRTRFFFSSLLALLYAKAKRKKYIHVEHGSAFVDMRSGLISFASYLYDKALSPLIFRGADKVVPISYAVKSFINREFLPGRKLEVIYRGVEMSEMEKSKPDWKFAAENKGFLKICALGRLTKNKGIDIAIKAFRGLPDNLKKKSRLFIIGDGPDMQALEKLAQGEKNIIFLGRLERKKAWSVLQSTDIFLNPAVSSGGLSTSLLEAMYFGLPVISTKFEGGGDVILDGRNGLKVKDNSAEAVKAAIIWLTDNKEKMAELGKGASAYVKENFRWESVIERYDRLFRELEKSTTS